MLKTFYVTAEEEVMEVPAEVPTFLPGIIYVGESPEDIVKKRRAEWSRVIANKTADLERAIQGFYRFKQKHPLEGR